MGIKNTVNKKILKLINIQTYLPFVIVIVIVCLVLFPNKVIEAAKSGIKLWGLVVFPSLFPFFILTDLLNNTNLIEKLGKTIEPFMRPIFGVPGCASFAFILGIVSGYPTGAKITADMFDKKYINKNDAERMLGFCNNSGPLFITAAISAGMLHMPQIGIFLLSCHIIGGLITGILLNLFNNKKHIQANIIELMQSSHKNNCFVSKSFGTILGEAVSKSIVILLNIGGYIIFFSVLIQIIISSGVLIPISNLLSNLFSLNTEIFSSMLCGLIEITTGISKLSNLDINILIKISLISFLCGWAGFSIHCQVSSVISGRGIRLTKYFIGKGLHGFISAILTYFGGIFILDIQTIKMQESSIFNQSYLTPIYIKLSCILIIVASIYINIINRHSIIKK